MPRYGYRCPVHEEFSEWLEFREVDERGGVPQSMPCPVVLYEGDENDAGEIDSESVVLCGEDSPLVLGVPCKSLFDRATMRRHSYPAESGMDGPDRPSLRDPNFMEKAREKHQVKVNKRKGRKVFTGDLGKPPRGDV